MPKGNFIHGKRYSSVYFIWQGMRDRCNNKRSRDYKHYGARGIKVCERWQTFENFYEDMGDKPDNCSLDRIDNNGNYEILNCRWATQREQARNTRVNRLLEYNREIKTITDWAKQFGLSRAAVYQRLKMGWTVEEALTRPKRWGWTWNKPNVDKSAAKLTN